MPNNLSDDFACTPVILFGTTSLTGQAYGALLQECAANLKIPLFGISKLRGRLDRSNSFALSLDEHRKFASDLVLFGERQRSTFTNNCLRFRIKLHRVVLLTEVQKHDTADHGGREPGSE